MCIYRHIPTGTMMATTITNQSGWTVLPFTWEEYQAALMRYSTTHSQDCGIAAVQKYERQDITQSLLPL